MIPDLFKSLHAEIMDCELKGQLALADALRRSLNRSIRLSGLGDSLAFPEQAGTLYPSGEKGAARGSETPALANPVL